MTISAPIINGELLWQVTPRDATTTTISYDAQSMETVVTLIDGAKYPADTEGISLRVTIAGTAAAEPAMAGWFVRKDMSVESRRELIRQALSVLLTK